MNKIIETNPIHILLVEDDEAVSTFLEDLLVSENYKVSIATCGLDAIYMVKENIYHIIILDLNLPDIDGTEVLKEIKNIDNDVNIVILTGCPSLESAVDTLKHGAYDYIQKPFKIDNIKRVIENIITEKGLVHKEVDDLIEDIGRKIRDLRKQQNISLRQLSRRTGLSNSLLSQVENSKIWPSITTLDKIARALNVNIVQFFEEAKIKEIAITRKNQRRIVPSGKKGITLEMLSKGVANKKLQPMYIKFKGSNSSFQKSHIQGGEEFILVLSGKLEIICNNCNYILESGDSIQLDASILYHLKNPGDENVDAVWVTTPPNF